MTIKQFCKGAVGATLVSWQLKKYKHDNQMVLQRCNGHDSGCLAKNVVAIFQNSLGMTIWQVLWHPTLVALEVTI